MSERVLPPRLQARIDKARDIETTMLLLVQHMKYPMDHQGNVLDMNHLPDVPAVLAYHLTRLGWRCDQDKALVKQRPVRAPGYYEDLVAYVPIDSPDEPIEITEPAPVSEAWSVKPEVNDIYEARTE